MADESSIDNSKENVNIYQYNKTSELQIMAETLVGGGEMT